MRQYKMANVCVTKERKAQYKALRNTYHFSTAWCKKTDLNFQVTFTKFTLNTTGKWKRKGAIKQDGLAINSYICDLFHSITARF